MGHPRGTHSRYVIGCCLTPLEICGVKNNSRRITYRIGCVWGMPSLSPLSSLGITPIMLRICSTFDFWNKSLNLSYESNFLLQLKPMYALYTVVCSQTLYFFFKVHQARVIKYRPQGIYWLPTQEGSGGGRRTFFSFLSRPPRSFSRAHSHAMFLKKTKRKIKHFGTNERKNKTTSVYRLIYRFSQG